MYYAYNSSGQGVAPPDSSPWRESRDVFFLMNWVSEAILGPTSVEIDANIDAQIDIEQVLKNDATTNPPRNSDFGDSFFGCFLAREPLLIPNWLTSMQK